MTSIPPDKATTHNTRTSYKRQSNLELLRIVAMSLVLLIHYIPTRGIPSPETIRTDFWGTLFNLELRSIAFVCVNCFVLISGYFGIRWRIKSFSSLLFQIVFWLAAGVLISRFLLSENTSDWLPRCIDWIMARWFVSAYICLYIIAPIINDFVEKRSQRQLGLYIFAFYAFSTLYGYLCLSKEFNEGMSAISLLGIYLTGAYLRRYRLRITSFSAKTDLLIYFALGIALVFCNILLLEAGISKSLYGYLNPLVLTSSVYLFLFFKKINIGHCIWINYVAASAFSVYLFHMHPMIHGHYQDICKSINGYGEWTFPLLVAFIIGIFAFCTIIDHIRMAIFDSAWSIPTKSYNYRQKTHI